MKLRTEENDTIQILYSKFQDALRELDTESRDIRVMTLLGSKGLDAEHVYIMGCNDGYIPRKKQSTHLTNEAHIQEQKRLLFVGVTRAKKSLTLTWSKNILLNLAYADYMNIDTSRSAKHDGQDYCQGALSRFLEGIKGIF